MSDAPVHASWFQRYLLPGFAFKAVVIGGGYATGRELAEFFLPSGPWGGIAAMMLAMIIWGVVCVATFLFARASGARDYLSFFRALLGRGWVVFEIAYIVFVVLILAVFGAAAGAIGEAMFQLPKIVGTLMLMICIAGVVTFGNVSVERLFKYVSFLLYGVYVLFVVLSFTHFGDRIVAGFAIDAPTNRLGDRRHHVRELQHHRRHRDPASAAPSDAAIAMPSSPASSPAPLAMMPAILFFIMHDRFLSRHRE